MHQRACRIVRASNSRSVCTVPVSWADCTQIGTNVQEKNVPFLARLNFPGNGKNEGMANRIKEIRKDRGLSQDKLADLVNTGRSTIAKLESGERRLSQDWMVRLSQALRCNITDLLPEEAVSPSNEDEQDMLGLFRSLTKEQQIEILEIGRVIARRSGKD